MTTRRYREEDRSFVEEMLVAACFPPTRALPTVEEARQIPHAARWQEPPIGDADVVMVAEADGVAIGAAVGRRFASPDPGWGVIAPDVPELAMAVLPEHRGRRVGESLLRSWIDELHARGLGSASLTVSVHNEPAQRLYVRCGFRVRTRDDRRVVMSLSDARLPRP